MIKACLPEGLFVRKIHNQNPPAEDHFPVAVDRTVYMWLEMWLYKLHYIVYKAIQKGIHTLNLSK